MKNSTNGNGATRYSSELIKWTMSTTGVTVKQLTQEGFCNDTISRARGGGNITVDKLFALTDRLGIIRKYLFEDGLTEDKFGKALQRG